MVNVEEVQTGFSSVVAEKRDVVPGMPPGLKALLPADGSFVRLISKDGATAETLQMGALQLDGNDVQTTVFGAWNAAKEPVGLLSVEVFKGQTDRSHDSSPAAGHNGIVVFPNLYESLLPSKVWETLRDTMAPPNDTPAFRPSGFIPPTDASSAQCFFSAAMEVLNAKGIREVVFYGDTLVQSVPGQLFKGAGRVAMLEDGVGGPVQVHSVGTTYGRFPRLNILRKYFIRRVSKR